MLDKCTNICPIVIHPNSQNHLAYFCCLMSYRADRDLLRDLLRDYLRDLLRDLLHDLLRDCVARFFARFRGP